MMSQYNLLDEEKYGIKTGMNIFLKRLTIKGVVCSDPQHISKYLESFTTNMTNWVAEGKIKTREDVVVGIDNAPVAFVRMLQGNKLGKIVVKVDDN
ncbi:hypothetical protein PC116_g29969 [Phytophthora cactorum]|nr:hypothetical protein PC116_g29969 [Phytophthora cactorum]